MEDDYKQPFKLQVIKQQDDPQEHKDYFFSFFNATCLSTFTTIS